MDATKVKSGLQQQDSQEVNVEMIDTEQTSEDDEVVDIVDDKEGDQTQDDNEDPILREIPVFLTNELLNRIHILQFHSKPSHLPVFNENSTKTTEENILDIKYEPISNKFKITTGINTKSKFYDKQKTLGSIRKEKEVSFIKEEDDDDGQDKEETSKHDSKSKLNKHFYESSSVDKLSECQNYAVGLFDGEAIHITPLTSILQMNTIFPYLNIQQTTESTEDEPPPSKKSDTSSTPNTKPGVAAAKTSATDTEDESATKIQVKFKNLNVGLIDKESIDDPKRKVGMKQKYSVFSKKVESVPWIELECAGFDEEEFHKLALDITDEDELWGEGEIEEDEDNNATSSSSSQNVGDIEYASAVASQQQQSVYLQTPLIIKEEKA